MPTPEENMQSVRAFAEEVFGEKNLQYASDRLADDFVEHQVFPGTTPDMTAEIHDMVAAGDMVGQITEHWGLVDTIGKMRQLGLLPPEH
jgi:hypothetical protein